MIRLDRLNLGELDDAGRMSEFRAVGFDLDGTCTASKESASCGAPRGGRTAEGPIERIDNALGAYLVSLYRPWFDSNVASASVQMSHFSFLDTREDGSATLYLGTKEGIEWVIPLVNVRLSDADQQGKVTLGAIAPREELLASVRRYADDDLCRRPQLLDTRVEQIREASDIRVSDTRQPTAECDGISFGVSFIGEPMAAPPPLPPPCLPIDADGGSAAGDDAH